jgi:hypothetical protein
MDEITTGITTFHIRKDQNVKLNNLIKIYIQKTSIKKKKIDFFDIILGIIEERVNLMDVINSNQIISTSVENGPVVCEKLIDPITIRINNGTITNDELLKIPGRKIGRIPGEKDWYDVELNNKQFHNDLLRLKTLREEKKKLHPDEFRKSYYIEIKKINTRLRLENQSDNKNRRRYELKYKMLIKLRSDMRKAILYGTKDPKLLRFLGCTPDKARNHLEKQFKDGMCWENINKWEIDHIIPLVSYNFFDSIQMEKAFNYRNLQPLWKRENAVKNATFNPEDKLKYDNSFIYDDGQLIFKE